MAAWFTYKNKIMKDYSQRGEQIKILEHVAGKMGTFLDIGAFDPFLFSNTRALFEMGWNGIFVEPSETFANMQKEYGENKKIQLFDCALGDRDEMVTFYDSQGDAVSSTDESHAKEWQGGARHVDEGRVDFKEREVQMYKISSFLELCKWKKFDFIDIDVESDDLTISILSQLNLFPGQIICLETNPRRNDVKYMMRNCRLIGEYAENLLYIV